MTQTDPPCPDCVAWISGQGSQVSDWVRLLAAAHRTSPARERATLLAAVHSQHTPSTTGGQP